MEGRVFDPRKLRNRYFGARHGRAKSNAKRLIISDPLVATTEWGLLASGHAEVEALARVAKVQHKLMPSTQVLHSDLLRTTETAMIVAGVLGTNSVYPNEKLRERSFGLLNGRSAKFYSLVWFADRVSATHRLWQVESAESVRMRLVRFIQSLEEMYEGETFVLVSHGDPLDILWGALNGVAVWRHRSNPFQTGEIRFLGGPPEQKT